MFGFIKTVFKKHPTSYSEYNLEPLEKSEEKAAFELADYGLQLLRETTESNVGFDLQGLQFIDVMVGAMRGQVTDAEELGKVANIHGAYYGRTIFEHYSEFKPAWVKTEDGIGIALSGGAGPVVVMPITRVFRLFNEGDDYSLVAQFTELPNILKSSQPYESR